MCTTVLKELTRIESAQNQSIFNSIITDIEQTEFINPTVLPHVEAPTHESNFSEMNVYYIGFKLRHQTIYTIEVVGKLEITNSENKSTQINQNIEQYDYMIPLVSKDNVVYPFFKRPPITLTNQTLLGHCKAFLNIEKKLLEEETELSDRTLRQPYEPLLENDNELPSDPHE